VAPHRRKHDIPFHNADVRTPATGLEDPINNFLLRSVPSNISELVVDHDYTLLAMQRYADGSKGFWTNIIVGAKRVEKNVVEPLLAFQRGEVRTFKVAITSRLLEGKTEGKQGELRC
jgi:hypothetical protein